MKLSAPGIFTPRLKAQWDSYAADKRGSAAVEFAFIAVPFFFFIFGLMEICVIFIMSTLLEHGVQEASRGIRTGQAQQISLTAAQFKDQICDQLTDLMPCATKLSVDVQTFGTFGTTSNIDPLDGAGALDTSQFGYNPGAANEIVMVRAFYEWDLITPVLSAPLKNMAGNKHLIQANMVFRNEPFTEN